MTTNTMKDIEICMRDAAPSDVRANGDVRTNQNRYIAQNNVTTRVAWSPRIEVSPGKYTYVFGVDRPGKFTLEAVDTATGDVLSTKKYEDTLTSALMRFHFEVR
jgi:hypothetical protein